MAPSITQAAVSLLYVGSASADFFRGISEVLLEKRAAVIPTTLPGKWAYQGCYTDAGGNSRTLSGPSYVNTTGMTDESCISYCDSAGYYYAGTEYSQECYCGKTIATAGTVADKGDCSATCTGNSTELCGGSSRVSVFWNGMNPPAGPSTNPGASGYGFYGCYTEGNGGRALTTYMDTTGGSANMTVALCIKACASASPPFAMAGVEYADECYCGNTLQNGAVVAPEGFSGCNMNCAGNSSEYCGAGNRLDVYSLGYQGVSSTSSSSVASSTKSSFSTSSSSTSKPVTTSTSSSTTSPKSSSSSSGSTSGSSSSTSSSATTSKSSSSSLSSSTSTSKSSSTSTSSSSSTGTTSKSSSTGTSTSSGTTSSSSSSSSSSPSTSSGTTSKSSTTGTSTSSGTTSSSSSSSSSSPSTSSGTTSKSSTTGTSTSSGTTSSSSSSSSSSPSTSSGTTSKSSTTGTSTSSGTTSSSSSSSSSSPSTSSGTTSKSSTTGTSTSSGTTSSSSPSSPSSSSTGTSSSSGTSSKSSSSSSTSSSSLSSSSVSSTSSSTSTSTSAKTTQTVQSVANYVYYGCYTEGNGVRALTPGAYAADTMTVESCEASCAGYTYFGTEYGRECYCGNTIAASSTKAADSDCNMLCAGNNYEYCGAGNRLTMYVKNGTAPVSSSSTSATGTSTGTGTSTSINPTSSATTAATGLPQGWKYDGCYSEGTNGRALQHGQPDSQTNTVESCINACITAGYTVAGMEYGTQCYCDNNLYNGAAPAANGESSCSFACPGNANEFCGAGNFLSLYNTGNLSAYAAPTAQTTNLPGSWTYQGCYSDNVNNNRALFWQSILTNNNTATSCLSLCAQYGYMAAGMEYGDECYCGDDSALIASGSTEQAETDCQVACSGDATYYCGGGSRLSYYKWTGTPINVWHTPTGTAAGSYQFLIGGVVVPLITTTGINNKVVFMEKSGTGAPNTTGTYELDLAFINDFSQAWRPLHVKSDIFCSAGITLPDKVGRQLNIGGWAGASTHGVRLYWPDGSPGVPGVNDWQENVNEVSLIGGRWYPSAMIMTNGSVLVLGGEVGSNSAPTPSCEILPPPPGGYAKYLDWLDRTDPNNLYPFMFVLPTGGIFVVYYNEARIIDEGTFDTIKTLPNMPGSVNNFLSGRTYPLEGTGVMMPQYPPYSAPVTVMVCGGSANGAAYAVDNCVSTQPEVASPTWTLERMPSQRVMSCICALPDGTYLILNGATEGVAGFGLATGPNLNAVLYDPTLPVNQRFSIMASTIVARLYHSEAMLLPDGRVLVSGSDPEDGTHPEEYRVEVFNPPYTLSGATAPSFTITNTDWAYGASIPITASIPSGNLGAVRASMMAAVSSTHGNSMGQRTLFLTITCTGASAAASCTLTAPPTVHVAPPGWYQIFVLDGAMPGHSNWVRVGGAIADAANIGDWPAYSDFSTPGLGAVGS